MQNRRGTGKGKGVGEEEEGSVIEMFREFTAPTFAFYMRERGGKWL